MISYQTPSKAQETTYCRGEENQSKCDKSVGVHLDLDYLRVGKSGVGESAGRGLFAVRDIPFNATIALDIAAQSFHVPPSTLTVVESLYENPQEVSFVKDEISKSYTFLEGAWCALSQIATQ
jgi:hypothetical protein